MKQKEIIVNYAGSLVFIGIILLFLFSIVFVSRFVLSDDSSLQEYVVSTKTLLDDIDEVEKNVALINNTPRLSLNDIKLTIEDFGILESSYINLPDNNSFFTVKFNKTIEEYEGYYLLKSDEFFEYQRGQLILYDNLEGIVVSDETNYLEAYNLETAKIENVLKSNIEGVVIYEKSQ